MLDINEDEMKIPSIELDSVISMPSNDFQSTNEPDERPDWKSTHTPESPGSKHHRW